MQSMCEQHEIEPVATPEPDVDQPTGADPREAARPSWGSPFDRLRMRGLLLWGLLAVPGYLLAMGLASILRRSTDEVLVSDIAMLCFYLALTGWIVVTIRGLRVDARRLIGFRPRDFRWWSLITVPAVLLAFSIGASMVLFYLLSLVSPHLVDELMGDTTLDIRTPHAGLPGLHAFLIVLVVMFVAPITEEIIFRGLMLHRFTVKWGIARALVASSLVFGVCHVNPVGLFVFALVLSVIYARTRSLLVTAAYHAINNGVGLLLTLIPGQSSGPSPSDLKAMLWPSVVIVVISGALIFRLLTRYRPETWQDLPYFQSER